MQSTSESSPSNQHLSNRGDRLTDRRPPGAALAEVPGRGGSEAEGDSLIDRYWDAAVEGQGNEIEALVDQAGEELRSAIHLNRLLHEAGKRWRELKTSGTLDRSEHRIEQLIPQAIS